jgi:hypothetical protein
MNNDKIEQMLHVLFPLTCAEVRNELDRLAAQSDQESFLEHDNDLREHLLLCEDCWLAFTEAVSLQVEQGEIPITEWPDGVRSADLQAGLYRSEDKNPSVNSNKNDRHLTTPSTKELKLPNIDPGSIPVIVLGPIISTESSQHELWADNRPREPDSPPLSIHSLTKGLECALIDHEQEDSYYLHVRYHVHPPVKGPLWMVYTVKHKSGSVAMLQGEGASVSVTGQFALELQPEEDWYGEGFLFNSEEIQDFPKEEYFVEVFVTTEKEK